MENVYDNPFKGMNDVGQAEEILNQYRRDYPTDLSGAEKVLNDLLNVLLATDTQLTGDADDFHNFAVSISKLTNDNKDALEIIREGLKVHRVNTDLLADAIKYGRNCGEKEACEEWYQTLLTIDKTRWTWRAFSFTIDYLLEECFSSEASDCTIDDILCLAKEYQAMKPEEEDAWLSEQEIYEKTNRREKGIEVLENAIAQFRFCPKCWLRYADIMMDDGEYEKAETVIKKMRRNPKTCEYINTSYMFFLDGQCKMTRLVDTDAYEDGEVDPKDVLKVYKSFQLALTSSGLRESTKRQVDEYIERLSKETGIPFPTDWLVDTNS